MLGYVLIQYVVMEMFGIKIDFCASSVDKNVTDFELRVSLAKTVIIEVKLWKVVESL